MILGMLFILLITNEVQYRTHRQNIIDGWSRTNFILAKFSVMIAFVVVATLPANGIEAVMKMAISVDVIGI